MTFRTLLVEAAASAVLQHHWGVTSPMVPLRFQCSAVAANVLVKGGILIWFLVAALFPKSRLHYWGFRYAGCKCLCAPIVLHNL